MRALHESYPYGSGRGAVAPPVSDRIDAVVLAAGVAEARPLPVDALYVVFALDAPFFARFGGADVGVAIPAASSADGAAGELNPTARRIPPGATHVALIAATAARGSLAFYA